MKISFIPERLGRVAVWLFALYISNFDLLAQNVIPAEKIITHTFKLDQIDQAYKMASSGEALKVVVTT